MAGKESNLKEVLKRIDEPEWEIEFENALLELDELYKQGKLSPKDIAFIKKKYPRPIVWLATARREHHKTPPSSEKYWWYMTEDIESAILDDIRYADAYKDWPERDAFLERKKEEGYII